MSYGSLGPLVGGIIYVPVSNIEPRRHTSYFAAKLR